jgi:Ca-activated chloride channel family protein
MKSEEKIKSYRRSKVAIATAAMVFFISSSFAQQGEQVIKLNTDLVVIDVTVTDKDGNFIRNLKAEDFSIYQDNEPQRIDFFEMSEEAALTRPLAVVFALDVSGSITPQEVIKQREATEHFMKLVRPESVFAIVAFNNEIRLLQDFTSDPKRIRAAFGKIKEVGGSSRIFGSIDRSVSMLRRAPRFKSGRRLRRVAVILSDGFDNIDPPDQRELIRRANEAEVTVYSITLPSYLPGAINPQRSMTLLDVSRIVPMTGGKDFSADAKDFTPVFKSIAEEIRASYTLAYYPSEESRRDGRAHQIRVESSRSGAIIRASRSVYQAVK